MKKSSHPNGEREVASVFHALEALADKAPGDKNVIKAVLHNVDEIAVRALNHTEVWQTKRGQQEVRRPQYAIALKAQEFGARLLQLVGPDNVIQLNAMRDIGWRTPEELKRLKGKEE